MKRVKVIRNCKNRNGSAGIALIAIIILVAIVFGVQKWLKFHTPDPDTAQNLPPWKECRLREKSQKPVPEPTEKQAKITQPLRYEANLSLLGTQDPRGEVELMIMPDGDVSGMWSGNYYDEKKFNCEVQGAPFSGKLYPAKIYEDTNGQDPTKLYFLAKGKVVMHKSDLKNKYYIQSGDLYVTGWLNPDFSLTSNIVITGNEKNFETFRWSANHPIKTKTGF
ncbi:MAG: hypothetical protein JW749_07600 [Sedimentisphaerales bacterium]|nr:hypothetical protein [Sedimentisphaerales bacterium]